MASRIWAGRCEDCYDKKDLRLCCDATIPPWMSAHLCADCIMRRKALHEQGIAPPPLGLLMEGTWIDAPTLTVIHGKERIPVAVKFLADGENAGIVRLRFDDEPQWFAAGVFGRSPVYALSEARDFLRMFYFPDSPISFA